MGFLSTPSQRGPRWLGLGVFGSFAIRKLSNVGGFWPFRLFSEGKGKVPIYSFPGPEGPWVPDYGTTFSLFLAKKVAP